jgi:hypothetical protein
MKEEIIPINDYTYKCFFESHKTCSGKIIELRYTDEKVAIDRDRSVPVRPCMCPCHKTI